MPRIPVKNGTTSINFDCASLTQLEYDPDTNIYKCEYSDWGFGLFAILAILLILIPLVLIINCWLKRYHKEEAKKFRPSISRQSSYSSIYPHNHSNRQLSSVLSQNPDIVFHQPKKKKKKGKLYYPYPAYGTFDGDESLPGSTESLYNDKGEVKNTYETPDMPSSQRDMPSFKRQKLERQQSIDYLSSSVPIVSSVLQTEKENLFSSEEFKRNQNMGGSLSENLRSNCSGQSLFRKTSVGERKERLKSNTDTSNSASDVTPTSSFRNDTMYEEHNEGDKEDGITPKNNHQNRNILSRSPLNDIISKSRILTATPPCNMVTRQDFDNYLADCVIRLPEDQRNGTFLIRNSTTIPNCKVLTLYSKSLENNASLYYYKIYYNNDGTLYLENNYTIFESIDELINFYRKNRTILPCLLAECLGRNF